jgi:hypothetical protein
LPSNDVLSLIRNLKGERKIHFHNVGPRNFSEGHARIWEIVGGNEVGMKLGDTPKRDCSLVVL